MFVQVSISLAQGESPPTQDAKEILVALGGNPDTDTINLTVSASSSPALPIPPPAP